MIVSVAMALNGDVYLFELLIIILLDDYAGVFILHFFFLVIFLFFIWYTVKLLFKFSGLTQKISSGGILKKTLFNLAYS